MKLTKQEEEEAAKLALKHPVVHKLLAEYTSGQTDPMKIWHTQVEATVLTLAEDLEHVREGRLKSCKIIKTEDKTFERVTALIMGTQKIGENLRKSKENIDPDSVKKDKHNGTPAV